MSIGGGYNTNKFVAAFYDHMLRHRERADVDFYIDAAKASNGPILEVCCGTGRLLIPIARERVHVTGLDLSRYMLDICRQKLDKEPDDVTSRVRLVEADMRDFNIDEQFGLAMIPFRSFQHLITVDDQCACLKAVHRHLNKDGRLIFDLFNPRLETLVADNIGIEQTPEPEFTMPDGRRVVRWHKFFSKDRSSQVNHMEMVFYVTHVDGQTERLVHAFPIRYLYRYEAEHLLVRCGYELLNVYADFEKNPYGSTHPGELILVARKI